MCMCVSGYVCVYVRDKEGETEKLSSVAKMVKS